MQSKTNKIVKQQRTLLAESLVVPQKFENVTSFEGLN